MTLAPDNQMHQTASLTTWKYTKNYMYTVTKNRQKKTQPNFSLQTTRKQKILIILSGFWRFLFCLKSLASVEFYKLTTLDKMILSAVKLSRFDVSSTQLKRGLIFHSNLFTDNQWQKAVFVYVLSFSTYFKKTSSCHSYAITATASINIYVNSSDPELYKLSFSRFGAKPWNKIPCHVQYRP